LQKRPRARLRTSCPLTIPDDGWLLDISRALDRINDQSGRDARAPYEGLMRSWVVQVFLALAVAGCATQPATCAALTRYEFEKPEMGVPFRIVLYASGQAQAKEAGTDPLGFYQPPFAYAAMQVLEQAIKATGSLNDDKLASYIHNNAFNTIVGDIRFNELGEWATARMLLVQFQNVQGSGLDQYMTGHKQVILYPPEYKDGELEAPFAK